MALFYLLQFQMPKTYFMVHTQRMLNFSLVVLPTVINSFAFEQPWFNHQKGLTAICASAQSSG